MWQKQGSDLLPLMIMPFHFGCGKRKIHLNYQQVEPETYNANDNANLINIALDLGLWG